MNKVLDAQSNITIIQVWIAAPQDRQLYKAENHKNPTRQQIRHGLRFQSTTGVLYQQMPHIAFLEHIKK